MCDPQTFDSRDSRYKRPYGAVPSGTRVELALRPPRAGGFSAATLIAYFEHRDEERRELPMPWRGLEGDRDVFAVTLETGDYVGLVWYSFRLEGLDGRREELGPFQLTVYDGAEEVPAWFGEGVTYQIFPDRFRRTRVPDPTGMVGGRSVHTGWEEEPVYRPDRNGEVRNRDFFGGDLAGVREKLGYLRGLGVDTLYFCPIFEAPENHRYGTGDYEKIDPMLGTEADFRALCTDAHALGMRVVLDGVFNHQGFVSRYFNGDGSYESVGAVQSQDSPYYPWYHFSHWPDKYDSWWGIYSLPAVNEADSSYRRYIFGGADSIIRRWCPKASILLDLACGTGTLSIELARLGYDVVGTDASEQMLSEAMQNKARALYGEDFEREEPSDPSIERLLFLCQPMQQLDMYGTIDAAVCALDSLNHITDLAVVQKVFDRVSLFMNPGAVFVFDVNSVYKHREVLGNNVFVFDREDVFCVWQNTLSEDGFQVQMDLDFFAYNNEDDRYTRTQESFCERAYTDEEIRGFIEKSGMKLLETYAGDSFEPVQPDTQRIVYVAQKI